MRTSVKSDVNVCREKVQKTLFSSFYELTVMCDVLLLLHGQCFAHSAPYISPYGTLCAPANDKDA